MMIAPDQMQELVREYGARLHDPWWRITSGALYKIMTKDNPEDEGTVVPFVPNEIQRGLLLTRHNRNAVVKSRQVGSTTVYILADLDHALFNANQRCGIVGHDDDACRAIFRDKVRFAYENLPEPLRVAMPLRRESADELLFAHNNSSIRVATSMRSGTLQRLLVTEYAKLSAKFPHRAKEVKLGSFPTVPNSGVITVESTAEGLDGEYADLVRTAEASMALAIGQKRQLHQLEWRRHFVGWWMNRSDETDPTNIVITPAEHEYFDRIEMEMGAKAGTITLRKRAWYIATRDNSFGGDAEKMWQEYPSCVVGETLVSTPAGIVPIRDVKPDGAQILAHFDKGAAPVFRITTRLGLSVTCTDDHPILTPCGEFRQIISGLGVGDRVQLAQPFLGNEVQRVTYRPLPLVEASIEITAEMAEFIGLYMGDGSFHDGTVSIACDAQDEDTIAAAASHLARFVGEPQRRASSPQGVELRVSRKECRDPFRHLEMIQPRATDGWKRWVHVPSYIMRSPEPVAAAFLRGLFEADGHARKNGSGIVFFSKDHTVVADVQVLLLALGIKSKIGRSAKTNSAGYTYEGSQLHVGVEGAQVFRQKVGFISARKNAALAVGEGKQPKRPFDFTDAIATIEPAGMQPVYDITTATSAFIAGGIVVHNSPKEAFSKSTEGKFFAKQVASARSQGRIRDLPYVQHVPVNTFWDIGHRDGTGIWIHQHIHPNHRFLAYIEGWQEPYDTFIRQLDALNVTWGKHYLPHDATHERQDAHRVWTPLSVLTEMKPTWTFEIVPRVEEKQHAISAVRQVFGECLFDQTGCKQGLDHLSSYAKTWRPQTATWSDAPLKDEHTEAADAFMQFAQAYEALGLTGLRRYPKRTGARRRLS